MLDLDGNRIDRRNPQDIFTPLYDKQIPPGGAAVVHYRVRIPADATGPIDLSARVRYRKFDQKYMEYVYKGQEIPKLPVVDICADKVTLPLKGQIWFDTSTGKHRFYDGSAWRDLSAGAAADFSVTGSLTAGVIIPPLAGGGNIGSSSNRYGTVFATTFDGIATSAKYADLAERYAVAGRVEPGDLVEQIAADGVIEPLRRQRLRRRLQALDHIAAQRPIRRVGAEVVGQRQRHQGPLGGSSGVILTPAAVTSTRWRSGTSSQSGSLS
jgi:hypothetical protein